MEERGETVLIPRQSRRGWCGGVNIARLLPNPAWAIVPPPLLDVIKDFSHTTKRAGKGGWKNERCSFSYPTSWRSHDEAARGKNTRGKLRKYVNSVNITEGMAGSMGGGERGRCAR